MNHSKNYDLIILFCTLILELPKNFTLLNFVFRSVEKFLLMLVLLNNSFFFLKMSNSAINKITSMLHFDPFALLSVIVKQTTDIFC